MSPLLKSIPQQLLNTSDENEDIFVERKIAKMQKTHDNCVANVQNFLSSKEEKRDKATNKMEGEIFTLEIR